MPRYLIEKTNGALEILEGNTPLDLKPLLGGEIFDISALSAAETVDLRIANGTPDPYTTGDWELVWKEPVPEAYATGDWSLVWAEGPNPPEDAIVPFPPLFSTDHAVYGDYVSHMIPLTVQAERRLFRIEYGIKDVPDGTFAEYGNRYVRFSITDLDGAGDPYTNFEKAFYVLPPVGNDPDSACAGTGAIIAPDGRMLITQPLLTESPGSYERSGYACILQNPLADPEDFVFGPWTYVGKGFINHPSIHEGDNGPEVRSTLSYARGDLTFNPNIHSMTYGRWIMHENVPEFVPLSIIPPISGSDNGTQEVATAPYGPDGVIASIRTNDGAYFNINTNKGKEGFWGTTQILPWTTTAVSKTDVVRSPSGNLLWAYNKGPANFDRGDMTIAIFTSDDIQAGPAVEYTFDTRSGSATSGTAISYPHITPLLDAQGAYTGQFIVAYDYGRGQPANANDIELSIFDEAGLLANNLTFTNYTYWRDGSVS